MVKYYLSDYVEEDENVNEADIPYRYKVGRTPIPDEIKSKGNWIVKGRSGKGNYEFLELNRDQYIDLPSTEDLVAIEILESTPDVVLKYCSDDEQSLISRLNYTQLLGTFLKLSTNHLQSHVRTSVENIGQVEIDGLFVGVNKEGKEYIIPVEAKSSGEGDRLAVQQLHAMNEFISQNFPDTESRPVGVKQMEDESVVIIELNTTTDINKIQMKDVKRYRLVRLNA
jgi:hypothetical protein